MPAAATEVSQTDAVRAAELLLARLATEFSPPPPCAAPITVRPEQIASYHELGYSKVEGVLTDAEIIALREVCDAFLETSRGTETHTDILDLEPGHTPAVPKLRRVKNPAGNHPIFDRMLRHPVICGIVEQFFGVGRGVRTNGDKLNMKSPGIGSPVHCNGSPVEMPRIPNLLQTLAQILLAMSERSWFYGWMGWRFQVQWHQDWAFYPHTNDDILAVGLAIDDTTLANGATQVSTFHITHRHPLSLGSARCNS